MPGNDVLEARRIKRAGFDELEQAGLIFRTPGLECDGGEMFGGENAGGCAGDIFFHRQGERLFDERAVRRKKLHRPAGEDDVFTFHRAAAGFEVIKNGLRADEKASCVGSEADEDIHVESGDRFEIESRAHRAADSIAFDDAVGLHPVDGLDDFLNLHVGNSLSRREDGVQFIQQRRQLVSEKLMRFAKSANLIERHGFKILLVNAQAGGDVVADEVEP